MKNKDFIRFISCKSEDDFKRRFDKNATYGIKFEINKYTIDDILKMIKENGENINCAK